MDINPGTGNKSRTEFRGGINTMKYGTICSIAKRFAVYAWIIRWQAVEIRHERSRDEAKTVEIAQFNQCNGAF